MHVTGAGQIFGARAKRNSGGRFVDQIAGMWSKNVNTQYSIGFGVPQNFNETLDLAESSSASISAKGENALAIFNPKFSKLLFGFAYRRDFRLGINHTGNRVVVHMAIAGGQILDTSNPFLFCLVRQHRSGNHIANGVNAVGAGGKVFVDGDGPLLVQLNAHTFQADVASVRNSSDRNQHAVTGDRFEAFAFDHAAVILDSDASHFDREPEFQALFLKEFVCFCGELGVHAKQDAIEVLEHRNFGSEPTPD